MSMGPPPTDHGSSGFSGYAPSSHSPLPAGQDGNGATYGRARNAVVLGVLSMLPFSIVAGIPAIVLGTRALRDIKASGGALQGRGAAWCGIVMGAISIVVFIALFARL